MRRSLVLLAALVPTTAFAQLDTYADFTAAREVPGGSVSVAGFPGFSTGINEGFGGIIGSASGRDSRMAFDSDVLGGLTLGLDTVSSCANTMNVVVVYLDTVAGGFATTSGFTDAGDRHRAAISGMNAGGTRANLSFAPGFEADFAIAFDHGNSGEFAGLWRLVDAGEHELVATLNMNAVCPVSAAPQGVEIDGFDLGQLGLVPGDGFDYVATVLNPDSAFRGNEFHGVASGRFPSNPGMADTTLEADEFVRFVSTRPVLINEVEADTPSTDTEEFVELIAPRTTVLDGLVLVLFNGGASGDVSYRAFDVVGTVDDGFWVLGPDAVSEVDQIIGTSDIVQNGADAVALYLGTTEDFPSGTAPTERNLVDAIVYDTGDADDSALIDVLTPGQEQIDEDGNGEKDTESNQRCPDGAGGPRVTSAYVQRPPTPGALNDCEFCGNGTVDAGETCDDGDANGTTTCGCQRDCDFADGTTVCGAADAGDPCDAADLCDGFGTCLATVQPDDTVCGSADPADPCDVDDVCLSGSCEVRFAAAGTDCGSADPGLGCDADDTCDGAGACVDNVLADTAPCRLATGACDVAELCDGVTKVCPTDAFAAEGTICGNADPTNPCDDDDLCDAAGTCVARVMPAGTDCGSADGSLGCDDDDTCNDSGVCVDNVLAADTECRASTGTCDPAEVCDGSAAACPGDSFEPDGTVCATADPGDPCDADDVCASGACEARSAADGTACDDGVVCNGDEVCASGSCADAADLDCDDDDPCTADSCAEPDGCMNTPIPGCGDAGMPDAGMEDAGVEDAGVAVDAGVLADAGPGEDAGRDAGTDAGTAVDAGVDPEVDAGPEEEDAGAVDDDASVMGFDASAERDAGMPGGESDDSGCGCRTVGASSASPHPALGLVLLALVWRRRRK